MAYMIDQRIEEVLAAADEVGGWPYSARVNNTSEDGLCEVEVTVVGTRFEGSYPIYGRKFIWIDSDTAQSHEISVDEVSEIVRQIIPTQRQ